jgi:hypothetical protein
MTEIFNWMGIITSIVGFVFIGLIGFKRSAWWGPYKGIMEELDLVEIRFAKIGVLSIIVGFSILIIANII